MSFNNKSGKGRSKVSAYQMTNEQLRVALEREGIWRTVEIDYSVFRQRERPKLQRLKEKFKLEMLNKYGENWRRKLRKDYKTIIL